MHKGVFVVAQQYSWISFNTAEQKKKIYNCVRKHFLFDKFHKCFYFPLKKFLSRTVWPTTLQLSMKSRSISKPIVNLFQGLSIKMTVLNIILQHFPWNFQNNALRNYIINSGSMYKFIWRNEQKYLVEVYLLMLFLCICIIRMFTK